MLCHIKGSDFWNLTRNELSSEDDHFAALDCQCGFTLFCSLNFFNTSVYFELFKCKLIYFHTQILDFNVACCVISWPFYFIKAFSCHYDCLTYPLLTLLHLCINKLQHNHLNYLFHSFMFDTWYNLHTISTTGNTLSLALVSQSPLLAISHYWHLFHA